MKDLVDGAEHLYGNFYKVPFSSIITTDRDENAAEYVFSNPRLLTKSGTEVLTDKDLSKNLRENIKFRTLLTPFVCRWIKKDGVVHPQLVGGDRRYRALDYLISKKEMVADPRTPQGSAVSADIAYEFVVCQIFSCDNDLEAATLSWAENKNRVDLTEGHEIAAVIELRNFDAADDQILEILQKDSKWLHETDELIAALSQDQDTLSLFCENKIKRGAVKKLLEISDIEERAAVRDEALENAETVFAEKTKKFDRQQELVANKKSRAETKKVFAESNDDEKESLLAQKVIDRAKEREKDIEKNRPLNPKITQKQVEKAATKVGVDNISTRKSGSVKTIGRVIETIQDIIAKDGKIDFLEEDFSLDVSLLELVKMVLENHALNNSDDFGETLNIWHSQMTEAAVHTVDEEEDRRDEEAEDEEEIEDEGRPEVVDSAEEESDEESEDSDYDDDDDDDDDDDEEEEEKDSGYDSDEDYDESYDDDEQLIENADEEDEDD